MTTFDDLTDIYELIIDWPKRLKREEPFYRKHFNRVSASRILDAACGTGRHAAMFHSWGFTVEAADISPAMLARAKQLAPDLTLAQRGFDQPVPSAPFDAVVCIGNSLALAPDLDTAHRAIQQMLAALRPGGLLIIQVLNVFALADGPCVWQKNLQTTLNGRRTHILKGVHRSASRGFVDLIVTDLEDPANAAKTMRSESVPFLALEGDDLAAAARSAGAKSITLLGNYDEKPYLKDKSSDLILLAQR